MWCIYMETPQGWILHDTMRTSFSVAYDRLKAMQKESGVRLCLNIYRGELWP